MTQHFQSQNGQVLVPGTCSKIQGSHGKNAICFSNFLKYINFITKGKQLFAKANVICFNYLMFQTHEALHLIRLMEKYSSRGQTTYSQTT